jgi:hypothetical protein
MDKESNKQIPYLNSSFVSNFLGFFGQHSHIYGPLSLAAKLLWLFGTSAIFRGEATVRVTCAGNGCSLGVRLCGDSAPTVRPIEGRGEADILVGGGYGLLQLIGSVGDKPAGDRALGERRPNEPMLVMLLVVRLLAKLPLRLADDTLDSEF